MTAVDDIRDLGQMRADAEQAFQDEKAEHGRTLDELREAQDRIAVVEQERDELDRQLRDARDLLAERNGLYSRSQSELASVRAQLDAMRGNR